VPDPPAIAIPGTPRSLPELRFAADLRACEHCGSREPGDWRMLSSGAWWRVRASCPRCGRERLYVVRSDGGDLRGHDGYLNLGGPEPSTMMTAAELAAEIERLAPDVTLDPAEARDGEGAEQNMARYTRLRTALTELAKFIPDGAAEVPGLAGRAPEIPHARPPRYTRDWISGEQAYWQPLGRQLPRIPAGPRRAPLPTAALDRAQEEAHRGWLRRGRAGDGRLALAGVDLWPSQLWAKDLTASRWEHVLARRGDLRHAELTQAELTDVDLSQSRLDEARLAGARLTRCTLDGCSAALAVLDGAQLADCSAERLHAGRSSWRSTAVRRVQLRWANFGSSWLDGTRFTDCDLREAWFKPVRGGIGGTSAGTVFERCDLRDADFTGRDLAGATFVSCRFRGATGRPSGTDGWQVTGADFSAAGDGSDLGGADDLLEQLGRGYDPRMAERAVRYSTGNENNPADPFGRSELTVQPGGAARLEHHFPAHGPVRAWTGRVGGAALDELWAALDEAGFPAAPGGALPPDSTLRRLVIEDGGTTRQAAVGWHQAASLPGYATAFDIIDGVIRQLSGEVVRYRSTQPPIVTEIAEA
jgi:uncharacterized protein YjbI with pentapeptide repeats